MRCTRFGVPERAGGTSRRKSLQWLVLAASAYLLVTAAAGSAAATGGDAVDPSALRALVQSGAATRAVEVHQVTLVTGDRVAVRVTPGGVYSTTTQIAPRPDGRRVLVETVTDRDGVFVFPSDAMGLIASRKLDRDLFNVKYLLENGYADDASSVLPLILEYQQATPTPAQPGKQLPGAAPVRALPSVHGVAVGLNKRAAPHFWAAAVQDTSDRPSGSPRLDAGLGRVWLDHKVRVNLDQSVPMIGAPQVWASGYDGSNVEVAVLDTGVDSTHPDLADKVISAQDFSGTGDATDHFGHGTHVASTIAGSGAASGGRYRGAAPGAKLLDGKVLDDQGVGFDSQIIAGMQWAAASGARIVSMSLGGGPTDGSDPMSEAVNALTAQYGTLFVVAAGNAGPRPQTVGAPGAADAALTVAAVDKSDVLADFSSRGPRFGDWALKPDIAAPGVHITAARAAGTSLGSVVDQYYTSLSGTSMATPHVAASAALLAQEHPTWRAAQLKEVLTETAKDDGYSVYEEGSGRVDVAAAARTTVYATPSNLDFGRLRATDGASPITKQLTYRNDGAAPVTLALNATFGRSDGGETPSGMLSVSPTSITVPAGGTADVTVTLDRSEADTGAYSGVITADPSDGPDLRTAVGAVKEPPGFDLSLKTEVPDGANAAAFGSWIIMRTDAPADPILIPPSTATSVHLDEGVYNVATLAVWGQGLFVDHYALLVDPEVRLDRDQTVNLNAADAKPIRVDTGTAEEPIASGVSFTATPAGAPDGGSVNVAVSGGYGIQPYALPTAGVTVGSFDFDHVHVLAHPLVEATATGGTPLTLHPYYQYYAARIPKLVGIQNLPLVDVGNGTPEDLKSHDLMGKVALFDLGQRALTSWPGGPPDARDVVANAAAAGATAVLGFPDYSGPAFDSSLVAPAEWYPIPTLAITPQEGRALRARLQTVGPMRLRVDGLAASPYTYTLGYPEPSGSVPAKLDHTVDKADMATINDEFHLERPGEFDQFWSIFRPHAIAGTGAGIVDTPGPSTRTEYVGPISSSVRWVRSAIGFAGSGIGYYGITDDVFGSATTTSETWWQAPSAPGFVTLSPDSRALGASWLCAVCRYGGLLAADILVPWPTVADIDGHFTEVTTHSQDFFGNTGCTVVCDEWHLYRGGEEIPPHFLIPVGPGALPFFVMPSGPATYRLTERFQYELQPSFGRHVETTWEFHSDDATKREVPGGYDQLDLCRSDECRVEPLLFLAYRFQLGLDDTLAAPGTQIFTVVARHQPSALSMPPVAGLTAEASVDGGGHWQQATVVSLGDGQYRVVVDTPRLAGPTGTMSLRVTAWDTAGDRVSQTVYDAYGLRSR